MAWFNAEIDFEFGANWFVIFQQFAFLTTFSFFVGLPLSFVFGLVAFIFIRLATPGTIWAKPLFWKLYGSSVGAALGGWSSIPIASSVRNSYSELEPVLPVVPSVAMTAVVFAFAGYLGAIWIIKYARLDRE